MGSWKDDFLDFLISTGALCFGEFKTKSGRLSPYYVNTGLFSDGKRLSRLGSFYAKLIHERFPGATVIYGPAYKGIPLCTAAASALWTDFQSEVGWTFNRKEAKDHGDGGTLVGKKLGPEDRVVLVDDVITAGLSIAESLAILAACGNPKVEGIVISVNREEKNTEGLDAVAEITRKHAIPVVPLLTLGEILETVKRRALVDDDRIAKIRDYHSRYGV